MVLNGELYAQRLQQLTYLHLSTDCFMKISLQSTGSKVFFTSDILYAILGKF